MQDTAVKILGKKKKSWEKDWISEDTLKLAAERKQLKATRRDSTEKSKHYNYLCRQIKKSANSDWENFIMDICHRIDLDYRKNKIREVYSGIKQITGSSAPRTATVKDNNGTVLKEAADIENRWREYFQSLYNVKNPVDMTVLSELQPAVIPPVL